MDGFDRDFRRARRGVFAFAAVAGALYVAFWAAVVVLAYLVAHHYGVL